MAQNEKHPYYELDSGAPHMSDEDYRKMGFGSVEQASATCPDTAAPARDPEADRRIEKAVQEKLNQNGFVDASRIHVSVHDGQVRLEGTAEHRYARGRAEDLAREVEGVSSVDNHIAVQPAPDEDNSGQPVLTTHMPGIIDGSTQRS